MDRETIWSGLSEGFKRTVQTAQMNGGNPVTLVWDPHMMDVMEVVAIVAR